MYMRMERDILRDQNDPTIYFNLYYSRPHYRNSECVIYPYPKPRYCAYCIKHIIVMDLVCSKYKYFCEVNT